MEGFNEFRRKCEVLQKNKDALGIDIQFKVVDGKASINVTKDGANVKGKIREKLEELILEVVRGAIMHFCSNTDNGSYAMEKDQETQKKKHEDEFSGNMELYINLLIQEGLDTAWEIYATRQELIKLSYLAGQTRYDGKQWNVAGNFVAGNGFQIKDGKWESDTAIALISGFIYPPKAACCAAAEV